MSYESRPVLGRRRPIRPSKPRRLRPEGWERPRTRATRDDGSGTGMAGSAAIDQPPPRSAVRGARRAMLGLGMFGLDHAPSGAHTALALQKSAGTMYATVHKCPQAKNHD